VDLSKKHEEKQHIKNHHSLAKPARPHLNKFTRHQLNGQVIKAKKGEHIFEKHHLHVLNMSLIQLDVLVMDKKKETLKRTRFALC